MIITIIADVYGEENNGTVATTNRLMQHMINKGHKIRLVSVYDGEDTNDITYYTVPKRNFYIFNNYIAKNGATLAKPIEDVIEKAIIGSDVVHMLLPFKLSKMAMQLVLKHKVPYTSAFHAQPENITTHIKMRDVSFINNLFYKKFYWQFYKHQKFVHCPSNFIKDEIKKRNYPGDLRVISNGVLPTFTKFNSEKPDELKDKFIINTSSRYSSEKRHDLVIKAMKFSKHADNIQLIFSGKGPLKEKLEKQGRHLKNPIRFVFHKSKDDLAASFNYSDLYIHPADIEIEAIACMEAISCGVVPIVSDSKRSATKQFAISEKNLFKRGNAKDLAKKIDYWYEHEQEKLELEKEYVKFMEQFRIEPAMDKMEQMFIDAQTWFNKKSI